MVSTYLLVFAAITATLLVCLIFCKKKPRNADRRIEEARIQLNKSIAELSEAVRRLTDKNEDTNPEWLKHEITQSVQIDFRNHPTTFRQSNPPANLIKTPKQMGDFSQFSVVARAIAEAINDGID